MDLFAQHGYQTLVIWDYELGDVKKLEDKLFEFVAE